MALALHVRRDRLGFARRAPPARRSASRSPSDERGAFLACSVATAKFRHKMIGANIVRGLIKTGSGTGSIKIAARHYDFEGSASATLQTELFNGSQAGLGATTQPMLFYFLAPADSDQSDIFIECTNGGDFYIMLLESN